MYKRTLVLIIVMLCLLFTACGNVDTESVNTQASADTSSATSSLNDSSDINPDTVPTNPGFTYELKESYGSREEIEAERDALKAAYWQYQDEHSTASGELENAAYYDALDKQLEAMADELYPLSDKELEEKKIEALDWLVNSAAVTSPFADEEIVKKETERHNTAKDIRFRYKLGLLTLDEALLEYHEKIGIPDHVWIYEEMFGDTNSSES